MAMIDVRFDTIARPGGKSPETGIMKDGDRPADKKMCKDRRRVLAVILGRRC